MLNGVLCELDALLSDSALCDDGRWGLIRKLATDGGMVTGVTLFDETWSNFEVTDYIFKLSVGAITEWCRRFSDFGIGAKKANSVHPCVYVHL